MKKNVLTLLVISLVIFLIMKFLVSFAWESFAINGVIILTGKVILVSLSVPFIFGLILGLLLSKYFTFYNTDEELKVVGGGVLGCSFISGVCFGGGCLPLAVFGSIYSVLYIIPVLLGIKFSSLININ